MKKGSTAESAYVAWVGRRNSRRVDGGGEGLKSSLAIKMPSKARTVRSGERGGRRACFYVTPDLSYGSHDYVGGREKKKGKDNNWEGAKQNKNRHLSCV